MSILAVPKESFRCHPRCGQGVFRPEQSNGTCFCERCRYVSAVSSRSPAAARAGGSFLGSSYLEVIVFHCVSAEAVGERILAPRNRGSQVSKSNARRSHRPTRTTRGYIPLTSATGGESKAPEDAHPGKLSYFSTSTFASGSAFLARLMQILGRPPGQ